MKGIALFVVAAALLVAAVQGEKEFVHHKLPCVWTLEMDAKSLLRHNVYKLYVNSWYIRMTATNDHGITVNDVIIRPDITHKDKDDNITYVRMFSFDSFTCDYIDFADVSIYKKHFLEAIGVFNIFGDRRMALDFIGAGKNFTNKDSGARVNEDDDDEEKYTVYYNNITDVATKDTFALYVDKDDYVAAMVVDNDKPGERVVVRFKYDTVAYLEEFSFNKEDVHDCPDSHIFKNPEGNKDICGASTIKAILALVVISILSALL